MAISHPVTIFPGVSNASKSTAVVSSKGIAGDKMSVAITGRDRHGNLVLNGGALYVLLL